MTARLFINGTDYTPDTISDLNDLSEHIWYDIERKAFLQEITGTVLLGGQGFRYFQNLLRTDYDTQVPCTLSRFDEYAGVWETVLHGLVFVTDCTFDLYAQTVEIQLVDNSFFAKIENNKSIEFVIGSGFSKNGVDIRTYGNSTLVKPLFGLPTGVLTYLTPVNGYSHYEAMKYLVAAMSDAEIDFYSDTLQDYLDPDQNVLNNGFLFSGEALRYGAFQYGPNISFEYCYGDLAKLYNLVQYIEVAPNGRYRLRVEKFDSIRQSSVITTQHLASGCKEMINDETLFSSVLMGSKDQDLDGYFGFTPFLSTFEEQFSMSYRSNVDKELDLQMKVFITDTNLIYYTQIQQLEADPDSSKDNEVFYVICRQYNNVDWDQKAALYLFSSQRYLNHDIRNSQVLINNFTGLPATIYKQYQNLFNSYFLANSTGPFTKSPDLKGSNYADTLTYKVARIPFSAGFRWNDPGTGTFVTGPDFTAPTFICQMDNDSVAPAHDDGFNYNIGLWQYVIPITGYYAFRGQLEIIVELNPSPLSFNQKTFYGYSYMKAHIIKDDGVNITAVPLAFNNRLNFNPNTPRQEKNPPSRPFTVTTAKFINAISEEVLFTAGDKIRFGLEIFHSPPPDNLESWEIYITQNNEFYCDTTNVSGEAGGDIVQVEDGNNYLLKNEWSGNLPLPTWQQISASPFSKLNYQVNDAGEGRSMWILDMTRKIISGETTAQLAGRLVDTVPSPIPSAEIDGGPEEEPE